MKGKMSNMNNPPKTFATRVITVAFFGSMLIFLGCLSPLGAAPPMLKVSGNQIVTANGGCTVRLTGVNCDSLEWDTAGEFPAGGSFLSMVNEAIQYWKVNVVRIPLDQDWWDGNAQSSTGPGRHQPSGLPKPRGFDRGLCQANNIYCDLDLQWSGDGPTGSAIQQYSMPDENSLTFWTSVAARYANNPSCSSTPSTSPTRPPGPSGKAGARPPRGSPRPACSKSCTRSGNAGATRHLHRRRPAVFLLLRGMSR